MQPLDVLQEITSPMTDEAIRAWPISRLREIHIEFGRQCNVRCVMCYQTDFSPATKTADVIWRERFLPAYPTAKIMTISGGEPTILPGAREVLKMVMEDYPHLKLNTVTNGVLFRGIWEEAFLKHGDYLNVSLNAVNPELYKKIVQFGRHEDVARNIDRMVARRNETGSSLKIRISTVVLDETAHEMADFIQWAADHGLDQVLIFADHFGKINRYDVNEMQAFIAEAYECADRNPQVKVICLDDFDWYYARIKGVQPVRPRAAFSKKAEPCFVAFDTLFVLPDGTAKPCCKSWFPYGNLINQSLEDVWNGEAAYRFRKRMLNLDFRDCLLACDLNVKPVHPKVAEARKAYWTVRRDPKGAMAKAIRKFGLSNAQMKLSPEEIARLEKSGSGIGM